MLPPVCGRYAASRDIAALREVFEAQVVPETGLPPDYNVAPTKPVHVVRERAIEPASPADDQSSHATDVIREIAVMRWGLVPSWAKDPSIGARMINARVETVMDKPAFRRAFSRRRVLLPADGFYEWQVEQDASASATTGSNVSARGTRGAGKQPWFIHPADGSVMAMAGLMESWRDPTRADDDPRAWLSTVAVITTAAPDDLGRIHERMPLVVQPTQWRAWLDPTRPGDREVLEMLVPAAALGLTAHPVSTAVNNVRNNGPDLLEPIDPGPVPGAETLF
jgi:putative SOS response-associated peptidase YedK